MATKTPPQAIVQNIERLLEIINTNQLLADKLLNKEFFKQHYLVIVLSIMYDGVTKKMITTKDEDSAANFLQDAIKYLDKQIPKLNKLQNADKTIKLEKRLQKVIDKVGLMIEFARLQLFHTKELDELIKEVYKKQVLDNVKKTKTSKKKTTRSTKKKKQ